MEYKIGEEVILSHSALAARWWGKTATIIKTEGEMLTVDCEGVIILVFKQEVRKK